MKHVKQSFTLIEILVVIVIIGILSSFIFFTINDSVEKASIAKSKMFSESIRNNLLLNLIGEWKFDEGSGTTAMDSWGNHNGTLTTFNFDETSGWQTETECVSNQCLKFDGLDDYISIGTIFPQYNILSFSSWISPIGNATKIIHGAASSSFSSYNFYTGLNTGNKLFLHYLWDNGGTITGVDVIGPTLQQNKWQHIVISFNQQENTATFYLNGVIMNVSTEFDTKPIRIAPNNQNFNIGRIGGVASKFNGSIDEVQIYNAAIPESQIKQNYLSGLNSLHAKGLISEIEYNKNIKNLAQK